MQGKILIAYYSQSGNTRRIAELIRQQTGGELYEIVPRKAYKSLYLGGGARIKKERENGELPELCTPLPEIGPYETVFIGTPNWGNSISHPVLAFLKQYDFAGKTIIPFCTHGGGGAGRIEADIKALCPHTQVGRIFDTYGNGGSGAERAVEKWIGGISG